MKVQVAKQSGSTCHPTTDVCAELVLVLFSSSSDSSAGDGGGGVGVGVGVGVGAVGGVGGGGVSIAALPSTPGAYRTPMGSAAARASNPPRPGMTAFFMSGTLFTASNTAAAVGKLVAA